MWYYLTNVFAIQLAFSLILYICIRKVQAVHAPRQRRKVVWPLLNSLDPDFVKRGNDYLSGCVWGHFTVIANLLLEENCILILSTFGGRNTPSDLFPIILVFPHSLFSAHSLKSSCACSSDVLKSLLSNCPPLSPITLVANFMRITAEPDIAGLDLCGV